MKKYVSIVILYMCVLSTQNIFADTLEITFDEQETEVNGVLVGDTYDPLGINFISDTMELTDPAFMFNPSYIMPPGTGNDIFWYPVEALDYPYPASQYLAMDKPKGSDGSVGVAFELDTPCTQIAFKYRRPGSNETEGEITVSLFDITESGVRLVQTDQITAYVYAPEASDADGDGWLEYSLLSDGPFNLVLLNSGKKFGIDDLIVTDEPVIDDEPAETANNEVDQAVNDNALSDDESEDVWASVTGDGDDNACFVTSLF